MIASLEDARWPACLSAFRLDRFRLGELSPTEAAQVQAHLEACALCRAAAEVLASAEAEFRASATPLRAPQRGGRRALGWGAGAVAVAAACVLAFQPGSSLRSKGPPASVGMYVQHGPDVRRALPGEAVAPGDSVRFVYSSREPSYLAILSLDGAGVATVYFPEGPEMVAIPAAQEALLPLATQLDAVLGDETVLALFCPSPRALKPVREALQASGKALPEVPGCRLATFRFTKRAP
jgi:anti-sigma factor RsiW